MPYDVEILRDHYSPAQALLIQKTAKQEAKEEGRRCTVSIDRKPDGLVEIEIKRYNDVNLIQPARYAN